MVHGGAFVEAGKWGVELTFYNQIIQFFYPGQRALACLRHVYWPISNLLYQEDPHKSQMQGTIHTIPHIIPNIKTLHCQFHWDCWVLTYSRFSASLSTCTSSSCLIFIPSQSSSYKTSAVFFSFLPHKITLLTNTCALDCSSIKNNPLFKVFTDYITLANFSASSLLTHLSDVMSHLLPKSITTTSSFAYSCISDTHACKERRKILRCTYNPHKQYIYLSHAQFMNLQRKMYGWHKSTL